MNLIFTNHVYDTVDRLIGEMAPSSVFVLVDKNTFEKVLPLLQGQAKSLTDATVITIPAGDTAKDTDSLSKVWTRLSESGATRSSVLVNAGGGMVTDLGGFAASTFKRGIRFINIPTTLLGAVDASVGGKTGVNLNGLKNEIGVFADADAVIISTMFLPTLTHQEVLSGYAEMLKHGLIEDCSTLSALLAYDLDNALVDPDTLLDLVERSVGIKKKIVEIDPREKGLRRALNLGHTIGHAFESWRMASGNPIPHGYAVAWGMVAELILSHMILGFPSETLSTFAAFVKQHYGSLYFTCDDYDALISLMRHDKKNTTPDSINFTLLADVGDIHIDSTASDDKIKAALDIFRDIFE